MKQLPTLRALLAAAAMAAISPTWGATLTHGATDLPDTVVGEDLWSYNFSVTGPLDAFHSINLLFEPGRYSLLTLAGNSAPGQIDTSLPIDPDTVLGTDGQVSIVALEPLGVTFQGTVAVSFVWGGAGTPGAVRYELLDDGFSVVGGGVTSPVPEPTPAVMLLLGIAAVRVARRGS